MTIFKKSIRKKGFTLIEAIVAFAIIFAALVGPLTLVITSLPKSIASRNRLVALHLAQEGIELIRLMRDNNIICDIHDGNEVNSWKWACDGGAASPNCNSSISNITRRVSVSNFSTETCGGISINFPNLLTGALSTPLNFNPITGIYDYSAGGTPTSFVRKVSIQSGGPLSNEDPDIVDDDQMDITVTVTWTNRGIPSQLVLYERLYNWR